MWCPIVPAWQCSSSCGLINAAAAHESTLTGCFSAPGVCRQTTLTACQCREQAVVQGCLPAWVAATLVQKAVKAVQTQQE
jgi:hypothetical protein